MYRIFSSHLSHHTHDKSNNFLGQNVENVLKSMQRQLLQIADKIPDDITLTLLKCFAKISSVEPAPAPKVPFIRAFTRRQDSPYFSNSSSSGELSEAENECTFSLKLGDSSAQEVSVSIESNEDDQTINQAEVSATPPPIDEMNCVEAFVDDEAAAAAAAENNVDEGIEIESEIPKVSSDDEAAAEEQFAELNKDSLSADEQQQIASASEPEEEIYEESEPEIDDEPIPEEVPKVSLDDIERELQQMQAFLSFKGLDKEKLLREHEELNRQRELAAKVAKEEEDQRIARLEELARIGDTYQLDFCLPLNKREQSATDEGQKYQRAENYRDEVIEQGPIFDPNVPNTIEDFMKTKSFANETGNKKKIFDMSWQNLCENQRKVYR